MTDSLKNTKETIVSQLFHTMEDSAAKFTHSKIAQVWLKTHDNFFGGFVNGKGLSKTTTSTQIEVTFAENYYALIQIATSSVLECAASNSSEGFRAWQQLNAGEKSRILYKIADIIEKETKLLNSVENLTRFGRLREKQNASYLTDSYKYCAGLVGTHELQIGLNAAGVVCIIANDSKFPSVVSALWQISFILAAGNAVLFLVENSFNLSASLLAELFISAGLPAGVFNVLYCDTKSFLSFPQVDKIIVSSMENQHVLRQVADMRIPCELFLYKIPTAVVYESADLDAAVTVILEVLNVADDGNAWPVCKINLQESVLKKFVLLLAKKVCQMFDACGSGKKPFFYIMGNETLSIELQEELSAETTKKLPKILYNTCHSLLNENDKQCLPAIVMGSEMSIKEQNKPDRKGPGIYIEPFRTVKESISMFNTDKKGSHVSIWTEEMHTALEVAHKLKSRTVWINSLNVYHPSVPFGSIYLSGNTVVGGKEGFYTHSSVLERIEGQSKAFVENLSYGTETPSSTFLVGNTEKNQITKIFKLYIGGSFVNSSDETVKLVSNAKNEPYTYVSCANSSDVQKAVASAVSSQAKWESQLKSKRAAIIHKVSELLIKHKEEFVSELCVVTGLSEEICAKEVELSINVLLYWASYITHFEGHTKEIKLNHKVFQDYYPLGVIGIQCADEEPLLSFIFLITPAIIFGNAVVVVASEKYPSCALKMCEVFQAAGLPAGILNVISSSRSFLTRNLCSNLSLDAIWFSVDGEQLIYNSNFTVQPKRMFNCIGMVNSLDAAKKIKFVFESTYSKAVHLPTGSGFL